MTVDKFICHDDYYRAYADQVKLKHHQTRIGSKLHKVSTMEYDKISLSFFENKRVWVELNQSLPYGHYDDGLPDKPSPRLVKPPQLIQG